MPSNRRVYVRRGRTGSVGDRVALVAGAVEQQVRARPAAGPATASRSIPLASRPPRAAAGSTSTPPSPRDRGRPRRSRASGRARSAPGRSRAGSRARGSARRRRGRVEREDPRLESGRGAGSEKAPPARAAEELGQARRSRAGSPRSALDLDQAVRELGAPPRSTRRGACERPPSSPAGRRRSRCRACTSCRADLLVESAQLAVDDGARVALRRISSKHRGRTRPCGRARPARAP